jgi:CRISPR-associated protein (TIGR02710 family)
VLALQDVVSIQVRRVLSRTRSLAREYDYAAVNELVNGFVSRFSTGANQESRIRVLNYLAKGFEAWDRFDHETAFQTLKRYWKHIPEYTQYLEAICAARVCLDPTFSTTEGLQPRCDGFEIVDDLVFNAVRRAHRKRYDDAVGRLYRASEMLVQIHLKRAYGIDTSDVNVAALPESAREFLIPDPASGRVKAPHRIAYDLLQHFPGDPIAAIFTPRRGAFLSVLSLRNASLFAHGFKPIERSDYRRVSEVLGGIIQDSLAAVLPRERRAKPVQLPTDLIAIVDRISAR